jgi:hypothetical protein
MSFLVRRGAYQWSGSLSVHKNGGTAKTDNKELNSVHPEIGKFGRDQGVRKILPQAYG